MTNSLVSDEMPGGHIESQEWYERELTQMNEMRKKKILIADDEPSIRLLVSSSMVMETTDRRSVQGSQKEEVIL